MLDIETANSLLENNQELFLANALIAREVQKNNYDYNLVFKLGKGYLKNQNFEAAKTCFLILKNADTNHFEYHFYLAQSCEALGELTEAREIYLDALLISTMDLNLLFEAYKNIGNIYLKEKNIETAEDFYHKAYSLNPESPQLLVNLGTLEMQKEDASRSIERFRSALQINPQFAPAWVGLALSYQNFGEQSLAWASILKAIECDHKNATALLLLSQWSVKNNNVELAVKHLMNYFDCGEFDDQLSQCFIELCVQINNFNLARIEIERALLWNPKNVELLKFDRILSQYGF